MTTSADTDNDRLSVKEILQINATVIAGIIILVSISYALDIEGGFLSKPVFIRNVSLEFVLSTTLGPFALSATFSSVSATFAPKSRKLMFSSKFSMIVGFGAITFYVVGVFMVSILAPTG
ncbi:MAG: hypothetical protein QXJ74_11120 [Nitrososphaera sp.]